MASRSSLSLVSVQKLVFVQQIVLKNCSSSITRRTDRLIRRRRQKTALLVILLAGILTQLVHTRLPRRVRSYERSTHWWDHIVLETFNDTDCLENFWVSRATFLYICSELSSVVTKQNTRFRKAISLKKRVAITIWVLATTVEYRTVGQLFGVARCTVCCIVKDTCKAIITVVLSKYIKFPVGDALDAVMDGFMEQWGIPQCVGSIDGSHIPVRPPTMSHTC